MICFENPKWKAQQKIATFKVIPFGKDKWAIQNSNKALLRKTNKDNFSIREGGLIFTRYEIGEVLAFDNKTEARLFRDNIKLDYERAPKIFRHLWEREWSR